MSIEPGRRCGRTGRSWPNRGVNERGPSLTKPHKVTIATLLPPSPAPVAPLPRRPSSVFKLDRRTRQQAKEGAWMWLCMMAAPRASVHVLIPAFVRSARPRWGIRRQRWYPIGAVQEGPGFSGKACRGSVDERQSAGCWNRSVGSGPAKPTDNRHHRPPPSAAATCSRSAHRCREPQWL